MTIQIQNTLGRLVRAHGYTPVFVRQLPDGVFLYSVGGIHYRIRGDGTIL